MLRLLAKAALIAVMGLSSASAAAAQDAIATYLGNEGVMVARGDAKIVFDAFYNNSYGQYALVPAEISAALFNAAPPYDGVDAVFVSHVHGDHFTAATAIGFLRAQPEARLYGPAQARDMVAAYFNGFDDPLLDRIVAIDMAPGDPPQKLSIDGLEIEAFAIPHDGGARMADVQNIAFRVTLDDETTVIHLGDADTADKHFAPYADDLGEGETDAAFPPYWFLMRPEGRRALEERIRAEQAIGIHVPAEAAGDGEAWRAKAGGDLFTDPGETREIGAAPPDEPGE